MLRVCDRSERVPARQDTRHCLFQHDRIGPLPFAVYLKKAMKPVDIARVSLQCLEELLNDVSRENCPGDSAKETVGLAVYLTGQCPTFDV